MTTPEKVNNTKSSKIKINESNHTSLTETGKSGTGMNESQLIMLYIYINRMTQWMSSLQN